MTIIVRILNFFNLVISVQIIYEKASSPNLVFKKKYYNCIANTIFSS